MKNLIFIFGLITTHLAFAQTSPTVHPYSNMGVNPTSLVDTTGALYYYANFQDITTDFSCNPSNPAYKCQATGSLAEKSSFVVYKPNNAGAGCNLPAIIYVHGGGYQRLYANEPDYTDEAHFDLNQRKMLKYFASKGFVAIGIEYRLGHDVSSHNPMLGNFTQANCLEVSGSATAQDKIDAAHRATQDVKAAVRYFVDNSNTFGIDPQKLFLGGSSAGAAAVLHALYMQNSECNDIFGDDISTRLRPLSSHTYKRPGDTLWNSPAGSYKILGSFIDGGVMVSSKLSAPCVKIDVVDSVEAVPTIFFHGIQDGSLPFTQGYNDNCIATNQYLYGPVRIADFLLELGIPVQIYLEPDAKHANAFEYNWAGTQVRAKHKLIVDFFSSILNQTPPPSFIQVRVQNVNTQYSINNSSISSQIICWNNEKFSEGWCPINLSANYLVDSLHLSNTILYYANFQDSPKDFQCPTGASGYQCQSVTSLAEKSTYLFYKPVNCSELRPTIIYVHGGGFQRNDTNSASYTSIENFGKREHLKYFVKKGFNVIMIEYRLGHNLESKNPLVDNSTNQTNCASSIDTSDSNYIRSRIYAEHRATQDVKAALRYFVDNSVTFGIDPQKLFLGGSSAGAAAVLHALYMQNIECDDIFGTAISTDLRMLPNNTYKRASYPFWNSPAGSYKILGTFIDGGFMVSKNASTCTETSLIDVAERIPMIAFHGLSDGVIPLTEGFWDNCRLTGHYLYGPAKIKDFLGATTPVEIYINPSKTHTGAFDTTKVSLIGEFFKKILYNEPIISHYTIQQGDLISTTSLTDLATNVLIATWNNAKFGEGCSSSKQLTVPKSFEKGTSPCYVYPNPSGEDLVNVVLLNDEIASVIEVHTLQGSIVYRAEPKTPFAQLELARKNYPAGMYLVRVTTQDGVQYTEKLVLK